MLTIRRVVFQAQRCHPEGAKRPKSRLLSLGIILISLSVLWSNAQAQEPPAGLVEVKEGGRRGFWLGLGIGAGGESNDLVGPSYTEPFYQPTISLRAGGTVGPHLRLGGEVLSWFDEQGDVTASLSSLLFVAQFYPLTRAGLYLKAGAGIGRNALDFDDGFGVGDTGFAGLLGAGYELRLGRRLYLNPTIDLVGHTYHARVGGDYTERLVNFGLGIVFQTSR